MMRRVTIILLLGLLGAALAYACAYVMGTAKSRAWLRSERPELAWLQHEFKLDDTEFNRISQLHKGYLPMCVERCRRIEQLSESLSNLLATSTQVTPEIEKCLIERSEIRNICQKEMLKHFFEVSRTMSSEQGRRYLDWVWRNTCLREQAMDHVTNNQAIPTTTPH